MMEEHRSRVVANQERERLALDLHDSVVRGLVQIGFESEVMAGGCRDDGLRNRIASIGTVAERCLGALREHLGTLTGELGPPAPARPVRGVVAEIVDAPGIGVVERTWEVRGAASATRLEAAVAAGLVRIGQEALANAEIHSGCDRVDVALEIRNGTATLTVSDDGVGVGSAALDGPAAGSPPHLGLLAMRTTAAGLGGELTVTRSTAGGTTVRAVVPCERSVLEQ